MTTVSSRNAKPKAPLRVSRGVVVFDCEVRGSVRQRITAVHPAGMRDHSRWPSAASPPVMIRLPIHPGEMGERQLVGAFSHPVRDASRRRPVSGGFATAQPPAILSDPIRGRSAGTSSFRRNRSPLPYPSQVTPLLANRHPSSQYPVCGFTSLRGNPRCRALLALSAPGWSAWG